MDVPPTLTFEQLTQGVRNKYGRALKISYKVPFPSLSPHCPCLYSRSLAFHHALSFVCPSRLPFSRLEDLEGDMIKIDSQAVLSVPHRHLRPLPSHVVPLILIGGLPRSLQIKGAHHENLPR